MEDACEDELNDGRNSITQQRLQNYDKPFTKSDLSNPTSEPTEPMTPLELINSAHGSEESKIPSFAGSSCESPTQLKEEEPAGNLRNSNECVMTATEAEDINPA